MATRSVSLLLTANVKGLINGLKTGAQATKDFTRDLDSWAKKNEQHLDTLGKGSMIAGGAMVAGVGLAIKSFSSFDKAMSSVRAATHETEGNMASLRKAAIDAGADTAFSASEAAQGIEELAKAGVSTADILGGGLDGSLALAAAGALDVGTAAELSATALTQFKLSGEQIPHVADLLAAGAGKAQGSVQDMGAALKQSGLVASQVGLTIEETTGGLAAFASAGLVGSDAGTSFKSMLQRLTPQSDKAAKLMDELGLNAYDAQGNFVGLSEYAGILRQGLADMTVEQRNAAMSTLFGSDAVRAAAVMYEQGADGVQKWEDAVNDAGYAAETAALMTDNLAGDFERLGGSLDSVFLKSGSGANDVLRGMVQGLEGVVDAIGDIPEPILNAGLMIAGVGGGAALLGGALITAVPKIRDTKDALDALFPAGSKASKGLLAVGKAAGITTAALVGLDIAKNISNAMQPAAVSTSDVAMKLTGLGDKANSLDGLFSDIDWGWDKTLALDVDGLDGAVKMLTQSGILGRDAFGRFAADAIGLDNGFSKLNDRMRAADEVMAGMVQSGSAESAAAGFRELTDAAIANGEDVNWAAGQMPRYIDSLRDIAAASGESVADTELFEWALTGIPPAAIAAADAARVAAGETSALGAEAEETAKSLEDIVAALFQLGVIEMDSRDATAAFEGALDDATATAKKLAEDAGGLGAALNENATDFDLTTQAGRDANAAFQDVARSGMAEVEAKAREGMGQGELQANLQGTYDGLMTALAGFNITGEGAEALARSVLGIPDGVDIDSWMSDAAKRMADSTGQSLDAIDGRTVNTYTNHHETTFVKTVKSGFADPNRAGSTSKQGFATGGPIFGPGTGTSDSIPALLSNGEHVWTADEVRKAGGHAGLERMRGLAKAGLLPAFAKGGRVGWSRRDQSSSKKDWAAATKRRKAEEADERAAQKAYDRIDGTKENRSAKQAAKRALDAAKKATKRAEKAEAAAKREYEDARDRSGRLSDGLFDLRRDLNRGTIRDSFASGNGMSVVDQLFDESKNMDLSKKQRSNLSKTALATEKKLLSMEKQSAKLAKSLAEANEKRDELFSAKEGVRNAINGTFDLGSLRGQKNDYGYDKAVTKGSLLAYGKEKARSAFILRNKMAALQKAGFRPELLQEVVDEWTATGTFEIADALLSMSKSEMASMNDAYRRTDEYANSAGHRLTESMHEGGLQGVDGLIRGLEDKQGDLNKAMTKLAKDAEKALKKAWGIASPSKVMRGLMHHVGDGAVLGLDDKAPEVSDAMSAMVGEPKFGGWSVNSGSSSRSMSAPVMELSAADRALMSQFIQTSQAMPEMKLVVNGRQAGAIVQEGSKATGRLK